MGIQYTEADLLQVKEMNHWNDWYLERFRDFLGEYHQTIDEVVPDWSIEDLASAVAIFESAERAFWFMKDGSEYSELAEMLASFDVTQLSGGQTTIAQYLIEDHKHYYKVKNGYVFFAG